ncbi:endonuclease/exonuclease/phosphatase family protein [Senna tora]|uniref:Endonuclease/exonuclease/phosphatase family protein n=1 Tax=Senna tora TaxID=362788 RepID=A0A834TBF3_9FABA|nr:endonuclease/exonuclease/phosphatase family protein [Senna tora]
MGKPTPKAEVMRYLKSQHYTDAKDFAGECEPVVMIAKGQSVQGTCKYGTRVDYILSSSNSPYKFVPGSYLVLSSKGTSDHHIVKVDVVKVNSDPQENLIKKQREPRQKVVRITHSNPSKSIWKINTTGHTH